MSIPNVLLFGDVCSLLVPFFDTLAFINQSVYNFSTGEMFWMQSLCVLLYSKYIKRYVKTKSTSYQISPKCLVLICCLCVLEKMGTDVFSYIMPRGDWMCFLQFRLLLCLIICAILLKETIGILEVLLMCASICSRLISFQPPVVYRNGLLENRRYWSFNKYEQTIVGLSFIASSVWPALISQVARKRNVKSQFVVTDLFFYFGILMLLVSVGLFWKDLLNFKDRPLEHLIVLTVFSIFKTLQMVFILEACCFIPAHRYMMVCCAANAVISFFMLSLTKGIQWKALIGCLVSVQCAWSYRSLHTARMKGTRRGFLCARYYHPNLAQQQSMKEKERDGTNCRSSAYVCDYKTEKSDYVYKFRENCCNVAVKCGNHNGSAMEENCKNLTLVNELMKV